MIRKPTSSQSEKTHLYFVNDATNVFIVDLVQDLLGDWLVIQRWSGKHQLRGGGRVTLVNDRKTGCVALQKLIVQKERHGYYLI